MGRQNLKRLSVHNNTLFRCNFIIFKHTSILIERAQNVKKIPFVKNIQSETRTALKEEQRALRREKGGPCVAHREAPPPEFYPFCRHSSICLFVYLSNFLINKIKGTTFPWCLTLFFIVSAYSAALL